MYGTAEEPTATSKVTDVAIQQTTGYQPVPPEDKAEEERGKEADNGKGFKASWWQSYFNFVRASVGPGCLALPFAFEYAGLYMGPALLTVIAVIVWYNMHILIETRSRLNKNNPGKLIRTYGDLGFYAIGRIGALLVEILLVSMELGICTVYFECISTNLFAIYPRAPREMEEDYSHDEKDAEVEVVQFKQLMVCCAFPVMMVLSWIRNMRSLAPLSAVANVLMVGSVYLLHFS
jgi:amino acid permease